MTCAVPVVPKMAEPTKGGVFADIEVICRETMRGIRELKRWSDDPKSKQSPAVQGQSFSEADVKHFTLRVRQHKRALIQVARINPGESQKQTVMAKVLVLDSFNARVCAVLRAQVRCSQYVSPQKIVQLAEQLDVRKPLTEKVVTYWKEKPSGDYRLIRKDGPVRTAQRLVVRDMLSVLAVDSGYDFTRRGAGGELAFIREICNLISGGFPWWWTPDIKKCFASLKPGHFGWLPIDRRLLLNAAFIPKCAKIEVVIPKQHGKLTHYLGKTLPDHNVTTSNDIDCPSSKQMGLLSVFHKGGSGSSLFDVKPLGVDGSSGGFGWSVF